MIYTCKWLPMFWKYFSCQFYEQEMQAILRYCTAIICKDFHHFRCILGEIASVGGTVFALQILVVIAFLGGKFVTLLGLFLIIFRFINRRPRSGRRLYLNLSHDVTINPHKIKKKIKFHLYTRGQSTPIKSKKNKKKIKKKSNFTSTLEDDQPP